MSKNDLLARGLCRRCYARHWFDRRFFGGRRERVRERDGGFCQACGHPSRGTRALPVHHRRPPKLTPKEIKTIRALLKSSKIPVAEIAARFHIARSTLYRTILKPVV